MHLPLSPHAAHGALRAFTLGVLGTVATIPAVAKIEIRSVDIESGTVRILFADTTGEFNRFDLQQSANLLGASWSELPGASWSPADVGQRLYTVPLAATDGVFFQIVGSFLGTALDPDGDGLPEALETLLTTDPAKFDTDGDGYSDGVEYAYGSDPKNLADVPDFTLFPRAEFVHAMSQATEGTTPTSVQIQFDRPYVGDLKYRILEQSTALAGRDFAALSGTVAVAGPTATLTLDWIDDDQISGARTLLLELVTANGLAYARGGQTAHTILLGENDAWWSGVLVTDFQQRNFRLKRTSSNGTKTATFAAGPGLDGLPLLPGETEGSRSDQSSGVIPTGTFPAAIAFDSASQFKITSPALPAPTSGLLGANAGLTRTLVLEALPTSNGASLIDEISPTRLLGRYTEQLCQADGTVCAEQAGDLILVRELPARPTLAP